jgi:hypothetical protein
LILLNFFKYRFALLFMVLGIGLFGCSWGRYPCPPNIQVNNSEKDGTGISLVKVDKNGKGLIKKKNPKRIKKKKEN